MGGLILTGKVGFTMSRYPPQWVARRSQTGPFVHSNASWGRRRCKVRSAQFVWRWHLSGWPAQPWSLPFPPAPCSEPGATLHKRNESSLTTRSSLHGLTPGRLVRPFILPPESFSWWATCPDQAVSE